MARITQPVNEPSLPCQARRAKRPRFGRVPRRRPATIDEFPQAAWPQPVCSTSKRLLRGTKRPLAATTKASSGRVQAGAVIANRRKCPVQSLRLSAAGFGQPRSATPLANAGRLRQAGRILPKMLLKKRVLAKVTHPASFTVSGQPVQKAARPWHHAITCPPGGFFPPGFQLFTQRSALNNARQANIGEMRLKLLAITDQSGDISGSHCG